MFEQDEARPIRRNPQRASPNPAIGYEHPMTESAPTPNTTAALLADAAHDLRNQVATLRSIQLVVDDPDVLEALAETLPRLQLTLERAVTSAQVEAGRERRSEAIVVGALLDFAARRAAREGLQLADSRDEDDLHATTTVVGVWAERLLADLLHVAGRRPSSERDGESTTLTFALPIAPEPALHAYLVLLADACGVAFELEATEARVGLPA
jgi:hypothetical protein